MEASSLSTKLDLSSFASSTLESNLHSPLALIMSQLPRLPPPTLSNSSHLSPIPYHASSLPLPALPFLHSIH